MPLVFPPKPAARAQAAVCLACHRAGTGCIVDKRGNPVRGRPTEFRISQERLMDCAFEDYVPGWIDDPDPDRPFKAYRKQAISNSLNAGAINFPAIAGVPAFSHKSVSKQALGKVDGDMYEILQASALWNAAWAWNRFMDTGVWPRCTYARPADAVATPLRRIAIVQLPRGYDSTKLLTKDARTAYHSFQAALLRKGMDLRLSSPDIVGVRIPDPMPESYEIFLRPLTHLNEHGLHLVRGAYRAIEGTIEGRNFLFAIAVKTSTRSDRLYQPLFEANVLKFIIGFVLRGSSLQFHVHMETLEGADVAGAYQAASLYSLTMGGGFSKAIDKLYVSAGPRATGQEILNTFPSFAV